ncbi:hypothetical protein AB0C34_16890 [Nocardia sp. NPDC049220]|uniref:hypothetical protein n=1 Tax=Nocardia sp. NPDC049220 TaxID=3155273 RepID=UPI003403CC6A
MNHTATRCPLHQHTTPEPPARPFRPGTPDLRPKCCMSPAGSAAYRAAHHCPCCEEELSDACLKQGIPGTRATCRQCGHIDAATKQFVIPTDALAELLAGRHEPTDREHCWRYARNLFGEDIAYHLTAADQTRDYLGWTLGNNRSGMNLRWYRAEGEYRAGSPCPHPQCRRGQVWTPVHTRDDLLNIRRNGHGHNYYPCSSCTHTGRR